MPTVYEIMRIIVGQIAAEDSIILPDEDIENIPFSELGFDSIGFVRILLEVEVRFGIEIDSEDLDPRNFIHVKSVSEYVLSRLRDGRAEVT